MRGLCLLLISALACAGCAHRPAIDDEPDYLHALRLERADLAPGVTLDPAALQGKPVVVTFFATWCFPCLGQLPFLGALKREHAGSGLEIVAVGMDLDGRVMLEPFAAQSGLDYPIVVADERIRKGETPFGVVKELPTTVILSRDGRVVTWWPGLANADEVRAAVADAVR